MPPARVVRIALLNLDSLAARPAVAALFAALPGRIGFVVASRRYGGKYGGFWRQTGRNWRRSGRAFVDYLGLNYVWHRPLGALYGFRRASLRRMARNAGADFVATREPNAPEIVARLRTYAPDLVVSLHFDHVLRGPLIAVPALGVVNVHGALLPDLRGPFPAFWTLARGAPPGVTVHAIDNEQLDVGPILLQRAVKPLPGESALALDARLLAEGARLIAELVAQFEAGTAKPSPQPPGAGGYFGYPPRADVVAFLARGGRLWRWRDVRGLLRG